MYNFPGGARIAPRGLEATGDRGSGEPDRPQIADVSALAEKVRALLQSLIMSRLLGLSLMVTVLGCAIAACGGSTDGSENAGASEDALRSYDREMVYDEVKSSAHAPKDLLSAGVTDARLVAALGWLVDQSPPAFYISAIRSDHHNDGQAAHAGGHALDMYAKNGGDAKKLVQLLNQDPYVVEIGLGGAYKTYRSQITHKAYFDDNSATHVHIGIPCTSPRSSARDRGGACCRA